MLTKATVKYYLLLVIVVNIKKTKDNKCWRVLKILVHCYLKCKLVYTLQRNVSFFKHDIFKHQVGPQRCVYSRSTLGHDIDSFHRGTSLLQRKFGFLRQSLLSKLESFQLHCQLDSSWIWNPESFTTKESPCRFARVETWIFQNLSFR